MEGVLRMRIKKGASLYRLLNHFRQVCMGGRPDDVYFTTVDGIIFKGRIVLLEHNDDDRSLGFILEVGAKRIGGLYYPATRRGEIYIKPTELAYFLLADQ